MAVSKLTKSPESRPKAPDQQEQKIAKKEALKKSVVGAGEEFRNQDIWVSNQKEVQAASAKLIELQNEYVNKEGKRDEGLLPIITDAAKSLREARQAAEDKYSVDFVNTATQKVETLQAGVDAAATTGADVPTNELDMAKAAKAAAEGFFAKDENIDIGGKSPSKSREAAIAQKSSVRQSGGDVLGISASKDSAVSLSGAAEVPKGTAGKLDKPTKQQQIDLVKRVITEGVETVAVDTGKDLSSLKSLVDEHREVAQNQIAHESSISTSKKSTNAPKVATTSSTALNTGVSAGSFYSGVSSPLERRKLSSKLDTKASREQLVTELLKGDPDDVKSKADIAEDKKADAQLEAWTKGELKPEAANDDVEKGKTVKLSSDDMAKLQKRIAEVQNEESTEKIETNKAPDSPKVDKWFDDKPDVAGKSPAKVSTRNVPGGSGVGLAKSSSRDVALPGEMHKVEGVGGGELEKMGEQEDLKVLLKYANFVKKDRNIYPPLNIDNAENKAIIDKFSIEAGVPVEQIKRIFDSYHNNEYSRKFYKDFTQTNQEIQSGLSLTNLEASLPSTPEKLKEEAAAEARREAFEAQKDEPVAAAKLTAADRSPIGKSQAKSTGGPAPASVSTGGRAPAVPKGISEAVNRGLGRVEEYSVASKELARLQEVLKDTKKPGVLSSEAAKAAYRDLQNQVEQAKLKVEDLKDSEGVRGLHEVAEGFKAQEAAKAGASLDHYGFTKESGKDDVSKPLEARPLTEMGKGEDSVTVAEIDKQQAAIKAAEQHTQEEQAKTKPTYKSPLQTTRAGKSGLESSSISPSTLVGTEGVAKAPEFDWAEKLTGVKLPEAKKPQPEEFTPLDVSEVGEAKPADRQPSTPTTSRLQTGTTGGSFDSSVSSPIGRATRSSTNETNKGDRTAAQADLNKTLMQGESEERTSPEQALSPEQLNTLSAKLDSLILDYAGKNIWNLGRGAAENRINQAGSELVELQGMSFEQVKDYIDSKKEEYKDKKARKAALAALSK